MATTVQNSDKKYLNFSGLAYYDGKIKAWVDGKKYITSSALAGYATESWVEGKKYITNDALAGYATESWVGQNYQPKGNYQAAGNYIVDNDGSLVQKINTSYTYWTNFLNGLTTPAPTLAELSADHTWLKTNKSGLESAASWVSTNGANVLGSIKDLCGDPTATGDAKLGRVGVLEQKIGKLTNATSWIGVVTAKPTSATVTVNGESVTCVAGDIVTVVNDKAEETGLEYIFDGTNWVELGDSSGSRTRLTELERALREDVVLKVDFDVALTTDIDTLFA